VREIKRIFRKVEQDRAIENSGEGVCVSLKHHSANFMIWLYYGELELVRGLMIARPRYPISGYGPHLEHCPGCIVMNL